MSILMPFDVTISESFGYFYTYDKALEAIQSYQELTGMRYCLAWCRKKELDYYNIKYDLKPYKIFWSDGDHTKVKKCQMTYDGVPYLVAGSRIYDCQFGVDRNLNQKRKYKEAMMKSENVLRKRQNRNQESKKQNCPALIYLREIVKFSDFMIPINTEFHRKKGSAKLQKAIKAGEVGGEMRVYVHFPAMSDHMNHSLIHRTRLNADPRIKVKIEELVKHGTVNVASIKEKLTQFVHTELFEWEKWPEKGNLLYYPKKSFIKSQVNNILRQQRTSQIDLENLEAKIESWQKSQPRDKVFIRSSLDKLGEGKVCTSNCSQQLLLLIQTRWQRELLEWYGQEQCVLDAAYKSVGDSFPLYFLLVKTSVDYQVVGSFLVLNDTAESISEALLMFRDWNPKWNPSVVMCGLPEAETTAIKQTFNSARVLMCDYQREQAWDHWLTDRKNNMATTREQVLYHLRRLAHAATPQEFSEVEEEFFLSSTWLKLRRLQLWFRSVWQPEYQRWAWHLRSGCPQMSGDTSSYDGVEQVNETLRHYLCQLPPPLPPISHILTILLDHFLPALYARHVEDCADLHLSLDPDLTPEGSQTHDNPSKPSEDFAHKCREVVDHIRSYTYLVKDQNALQGLYDSLLVSYENILQHNKDRRKIEREIQLEGVESVDTWSQKESPASPGPPSPGPPSSKPLEMVAGSESKSLGKVLVKPSSKQHTLPRDIVGSYIVHNNILELMKTEVPHTPEHGEEEEPEPQFSAPSTVIRTYSNNNMGKKEQKIQEKSSTLERLKLIPPEVFKLLMPADETPKPSRCSAETLDTKDKMLTKTFRILVPVPVKNKKRPNSPSPDQEIQLEKKCVDDFTLTTASITANPKRKQRKCYDIDKPQDCIPITNTVKYIMIRKNDLP